MASDLERVVFGNHPDPDGEHEPVDNVVVEGVVKSVVAQGMIFTVPTWDGGKYEFGPAPWPISRIDTTITPGAMAGATVVADHGAHDHGPHTHATHDHAETVPVKGDRCLVVFPSGQPWVIGWWPKNG